MIKKSAVNRNPATEKGGVQTPKSKSVKKKFIPVIPRKG